MYNKVQGQKVKRGDSSKNFLSKNRETNEKIHTKKKKLLFKNWVKYAQKRKVIITLKRTCRYSWVFELDDVYNPAGPLHKVGHPGVRKSNFSEILF